MNKEKLKEIGVNLDMINDCFGGNEEIYFNFLRRFFEDKDYIAFNEFMSKKRYKDAFNAAHGLKGVTGNLGMTRIYDNLVVIVEKIRHMNFENLDILYEECRYEFQIMQDAIFENNITVGSGMEGDIRENGEERSTEGVTWEEDLLGVVDEKNRVWENKTKKVMECRV